MEPIGPKFLLSRPQRSGSTGGWRMTTLGKTPSFLSGRNPNELADTWVFTGANVTGTIQCDDESFRGVVQDHWADLVQR